jgi:hypothetical protein
MGTAPVEEAMVSVCTNVVKLNASQLNLASALDNGRARFGARSEVLSGVYFGSEVLAVRTGARMWKG